MAKRSKSVVLPRLRFPEFRSEVAWRASELGDVVDLRAGTFVAASEISDTPATELFPCYGGNGVRGYTRSFTHAGKYALIGRQGALCGNVRLVDDKFHATEHALVAVPKPCVSTEWLFYSLTYLELNQFATGQAQPGLSVQVLDKLRVTVPSALSEQQKIADCLTSLDEVITAQARKVEALKTYKRGLMQQLFPRDGETVPQLRFPEFRDGPDWARKRISDLLEEVSRPIDMLDEVEYALVTVKRRYGGVVSREQLRGRAIKVKTQFVVRAHDFLISKRQIVHNACGIVPPGLDGAIVSNEYAVLGPKDECEIEFFSVFSQQPAVSVSFLSSSVGIVIEKMLFKLETWLRHEFLFPSIAEQRRIAACVASVEKLIAAESERLTSLRRHKQALMQQLFPAPESAPA